MSTTKPDKPYPDFPLFPHASGKWAKKVNGKTLYFGKWNDPDGALEEYQGSVILTLGALCEKFKKTKCLAHNTGEICSTTYADYVRTCTWLVDFVGASTPIGQITAMKLLDYKAHLAERRGLRSLGN
jgi:hypothetical protein